LAVLVEAISIIIKREALERLYPGGAVAYASDCPNWTYCEDGDLTRVGFMSPQDVAAHLHILESMGLRTLGPEGFADLAVVDQNEGPTRPCNWLAFGEHFASGAKFAFLVGTDPNPIVLPPGWKAGNSQKLHLLEPTPDRYGHGADGTGQKPEVSGVLRATPPGAGDLTDWTPYRTLGMARGYHNREYELSELEVGNNAALGGDQLKYHLRLGGQVNEPYWIHAGRHGLFSSPSPDDDVEDCETVHGGPPKGRPVSM
jgi:hypothetical protein